MSSLQKRIYFLFLPEFFLVIRHQLFAQEVMRVLIIRCLFGLVVGAVVTSVLLP